ncbi:ribonucleoside-triphosphate reductase [Candidatus Kaiserbacteria bacterium CG10_big_fil_rev_8_21_14_0_10_59_10]|uniref:ribonucleoside-triphosphate reductase (thioredoxin) n=1 Tax=Candidatus Kaiserbacteria bacterium CG10_big_fil_rev_8_21_14_0_10_59_10 TaxID=1974612 RepID=A0A2H0U9P7_9BACT|nr:MAG: ribonucleoside-triphosphate reductase [Candidatus Kaiserbacteria bacterium CG10_big_fil_rev_8_21_14_0_10_59_10]
MTNQTATRHVRSSARRSESGAAQRVYKKYIPRIQKRDGRIVPFEFDKIVNVIYKAMTASGEGSRDEAEVVAHKVCSEMMRIAKTYKNFLPTVEGCQDEVERQLMLSDYIATSKAYILYRAERTKIRKEQGEVPEHVKKLAEESKQYFKNNPLGEFVYLRTYARWIESEQRRETWVETVDRYVDFMKENLGDKLTKREYAEVREAIRKQEVMPSMRAMQFAGAPARKCNTCFYNCSFIAPAKLEDFAEIMYLSMQGCGVGYAVESYNVQQLPQIEKQTGEKAATHVIADTKEGWCDALTLGLKQWYAGKDVEFDFSLIRPAGARLKTMGGKASGPEPLRSLLAFARERILRRQGRRLRNIDAHDIICKIGECVVAGGVRRTAMISLSDLDDVEIRDAKKGQFFLTDPYRSVANNSAVYETKPTNAELMDEWVALMKSGTGERGIFNRGSLEKTMPERRVAYLKKKYGKKGIGQVGTNPCGEIILQSKQFCNLSEVIARPDDTEKTLLRKARLATLLGTYQSTLVNFNYISKEWKQNCEEERLLGVSITGQWDCAAVRDAKVMRKMRQAAIKTNQQYAKRFGIQTSNSITCVKPSGTVSQTFDCSSGIHPRHAQYYIRRIRISATDSLYKMVRDQGIPHHPEVGQTMGEANTYVLEFPVKAPASSVFKNDLSAIEQLEYWKMVKLNFTEHNPSATISVGEEEWVAVVAWLFENWDIIGGLSFLPRENHVYRLAPYEAVDKKRYEELASKFPTMDYSKLVIYERTDETEQAKELACAGGTCEIV